MEYKFDFSKITEFDWNQGNLEHIKKHNVNPRECEEIFFNKPLLINIDRIHSKAEIRFQALGHTQIGKHLFIVCTIRGNKVRIISARDQNKKERKQYQQEQE